MGLRQLHNVNVVHGNLKPENILLSHNSKIIKLSDFINTVLIPVSSLSSSYYFAPEVISNRTPISFANDVWSVGVIISELLSRQQVFKNDTANNAKEAFNRIMKTLNFPSKLVNLVNKCLEIEYTVRYTVNQLINNDFFADEIKKCCCVSKRIQSIVSYDNSPTNRNENHFDFNLAIKDNKTPKRKVDPTLNKLNIDNLIKYKELIENPDNKELKDDEMLSNEILNSFDDDFLNLFIGKYDIFGYYFSCN